MGLSENTGNVLPRRRPEEKSLPLLGPIAHNSENMRLWSRWRREGDSNSRYGFAFACVARPEKVAALLPKGFRGLISYCSKAYQSNSLQLRRNRPDRHRMHCGSD